MVEKNLAELNERYDLELERVVGEIKKSKAKTVLLQFPDGMKAYATAVVDYFEEKLENKVVFIIWMGSCFGACDYPVGFEKIRPKIDLTIQFGHSSLMPSY